jgi:phosphatidylinositol-3-phosphatase
MAAAIFAVAATALVGCASMRAHKPAAIEHVFIIVLENKGYDTTFRAGTDAPYLADTLTKQGAFLRQYYGIGHYSLDNYIAMVSGIAPTTQTQSDCPHFDDFAETGIAPDGQPIGAGCVYPAHVLTIANQLAATHRTWKGYMEDMGNDPAREPARCGHAPIGQVDPTERAAPNDQYAAKHDPFVYFHAIIDSASCNENVVPLTALEEDLRSTDRTPNYAFIAPNLCHDGHDKPCVSHEPGGLVSADAFLRKWVPLITSSPAFRANGLLVITFDEAIDLDATACCSEPTGPNTAKPGFNGPGGGRIGAVLLSPFIAPGTISDVPYNHYSMLRSIEDLFGLPHLGYARMRGLRPFGADVYTRR